MLTGATLRGNMKSSNGSSLEGRGWSQKEWQVYTSKTTGRRPGSGALKYHVECRSCSLVLEHGLSMSLVAAHLALCKGPVVQTFSLND